MATENSGCKNFALPAAVQTNGPRRILLKEIKEFAKNNWQLLLNVYIFLNLAGYGVWRGYAVWQHGQFGFTDISFAAQNMVMLAVILLRREHRAVNTNIFHQAVALFAFFSGLLFIGQEPSGGALANAVSSGIVFAANLLGLATLLNIGRSFGILIALRTVKTNGLYRLVRHPMYGTDILLRIGFLVGHCNLFTIFLFIISTGAYVARAMLEEKFLLQDEAYQEYVSRVKYRFIPFIF